MSTETLVVLCVSGLAVAHVLAPVYFKLSANGVMTLAGPRDALSEADGHLAARVERAGANFKETLPIALALLILVQVVDGQSALSATGACTYLAARVLYVPAYLSGVPGVRTLIWSVSMGGLGLVAWAIAVA